MNESRILSGNQLKLLAAFFMVMDHAGLMFFPHFIELRVIGRLAFPIFAFMIAEGARYTKNRLKYFSLMASLAALCQVVYYFFDGGSLYMCILVTFSLSLLLIFALDLFKKCLFNRKCKLPVKLLSVIPFILSVGLVYHINCILTVDYGFWGSMVPVFASVVSLRGTDAPTSIRRIDTLYTRVALLGVSLLPLSIDVGGIQAYSLFAVIPLLLYSGKRGKYNMKYFFYLFYPLHLVILEGIYILLRYLK